MKNNSNPSRFIQWCFRRFIPQQEGDYFLSAILETYGKILENSGRFTAEWWFYRQFFRSFPGFLSQTVVAGLNMINNYTKIALRNIKKYKGYSFINITGLAVGMACSLLIFLWVKDELGYDKAYKDGHRICRLVREIQHPNERLHASGTSAKLPEVIKTDLPEIEASVIINNRPRCLFTYGEKKFFEENLAYTQPSIFEVFNFEFIRGNRKTALNDINAIVITERTAKKYFGSEDPMGKSLVWEKGSSYQVTGVIKDLPPKSHIQLDLITSLQRLKSWWPTVFEWENKIFQSYVKLREGADLEGLKAKVAKLIKSNYPQQSKAQEKIDLLPITEYYLRYAGNSRIHYVYIFSLIAILILGIACINFINLSTARAANRAREVGLRKVVGSNRSQVIRQFLFESTIFTLLAYFISILLVLLLLPQFNLITEKSLALNFDELSIVLGSFTVIIFTGLFAGSYPALYLSSFRPGPVLKGTLKIGKGGALFRRTLVIIQFSLSIALIISTLVIYKQLDLMRNRNLGFNKENIICFKMHQEFGRQYEALRNQLLSEPDIESVTVKDRIHTRVYDVNYIEFEGMTPGQKVQVEIPMVDWDYIKTLGMKILKGRDFSRKHPSDQKEAFIVNEEAVRLMGYKNPLGKILKIENKQGPIIGVVKNGHFRSRRELVNPEVYHLITNYSHGALATFGVLMIKVTKGGIANALSKMEKLWNRINSDYPFEYSFFDQALDAHYRGELRFGILSRYFSIMAILISCLGLFGLASFLAEQKTREIGIRKVLGASTIGILRKFAGEFTHLILISNLLASPITYLIMKQWLSQYTYRIGIQWWIFALSLALSFLISMVTVGYQAIKAANSNPITALKYE